LNRLRKTRRTSRFLERLEERRCLSALPIMAAPLAAPDSATKAQINHAYGQLPLNFEANQGQTDHQVSFLSRGAGFSLFLTPSETVLSLRNQPAAGIQASAEDSVLRMQLLGANPEPAMVGLDRQAGTSNYLIGDDPIHWRTGVTSFGKVQYQDVYPGVNLVYYGNQRQLEYDFVVAPGADPGAIKLAIQGAESMALDTQGNLVLKTAGGDVIEHAPVLYQEGQGGRQAVSGNYAIQGDGKVGIQIGTYNRALPLVIDPTYSLVYSTYLGGSGDEIGYGIAVDGSGSAYVTGFTSATNFPTRSPLQPSNDGAEDVFVTKLNAAGSLRVYSTYLGGGGNDAATGIALYTDPLGKTFPYVTGFTQSTNFPTTSGALQTSSSGGQNAFVAELNDTGSALVYSSFLGASGRVEGIAVDGSGDAYVTGSTSSASFPTTTGAFQTAFKGSADAFIAKVDPTLTGTASLLYSTYLGAGGNVIGNAIAVDDSGNAYVTGSTSSAKFPTSSGAFQSAVAGQSDAFVAKLNPAGNALVYSTYLGGSTTDVGNGIAVDSTGNAYVTGYTDSTNFPIMNAYQSMFGGGGDAFVAKLNAAGSALLYSTYLGGSGSENGTYRVGGIAVDRTGNAYVTGITFSTNFPISNALQTVNYGGGDAFVTELNPSLVGMASLVYSTCLGGNGGDTGYGIAVDGAGNAYVTGETASSNFPTRDALQGKFGGAKHTSDAFVTKIDPPPSTSAANSSSNSTVGMAAGAFAFPVELRGEILVQRVPQISFAAMLTSSEADAATTVLWTGFGLPTKTSGAPIVGPNIQFSLIAYRKASDTVFADFGSM